MSKSPRQIAGAMAWDLGHSAGQAGRGLEQYRVRMPRKGQDPIRSLFPHEAGWQAVKRLRNCGTFLGAKVDLVFPGGETWAIGKHRCTHRLCSSCGKRRGGRLAHEMAGALEHLEKAWGFGPQHLRFATFTIPNVRNVAEGIEWIAESWHRALATKTWGRLVAGGFRCWEVKPGKDGLWNVHAHAVLVLWNGKVPYQQLRTCWDQAARRKCNIRFDELRGIKGRNGRSKGAAVAAYISKYLVKVDDLEGACAAPGGLPHLAAALDGRRLFSAFGAGAIARRWVKVQRPRWMDQLTRAFLGYRDAEGQAPIAAFMEEDGGAVPCEIPRPDFPACVDGERLDAHPGFEPEDVAFTWTNPGPKAGELYAWRKVPKTLEEAEARAETARELRGMAFGCQDPELRQTLRRLAAAVALPQAFRWGRWWKQTHPREKGTGPYAPRRATGVLRSIQAGIVPTLGTPHGEPFADYLSLELADAMTKGETKTRQRLARAEKALKWQESQAKPAWIQPKLMEA